MSATIQANKHSYLKLMRAFAESRIDGKTFQSEFFEMRNRNLNEDEATAKSWPERYDIKIQEDYGRGNISSDEFRQKWHNLWNYQPSKWLDVFDRLFRDVDRFEPNEAIYEESKKEPDRYDATYYITEDNLRERVIAYMREVESAE
jgi:hypothetical protein